MANVEVKMVKLSEIKLNPDNPRTISKKKMEYLVKSLNDLPDMLQIRPIVVDETMTCLGGNMRTLALRKAGAGEATVAIVTGLTTEQKREFVIKDNAAYGEWNFEELANSWSDLPLADWGVDLPEDWLKSSEEPKDAEPQIDRAEELNKTWGVKSGDLWQIGEHRLLCGDSTKKEDVGRVMGEEKATCVFTDPPYGVSIGKKNVMLNTFQPSERCLENLDMDDMKPEELKVMLLAAFTTFKTFMADDCSVFVCSPQGGGLWMMMMMMQEAGLEVRHILNWIKNSPTSAWADLTMTTNMSRSYTHGQRHTNVTIRANSKHRCGLSINHAPTKNTRQ